MNLRRLLNLVQAILVIAGLAVAPLVAPGLQLGAWPPVWRICRCLQS